MNLPDMGKQVGPLPLGAWVAVLGGSFAFLLYSRRNAASAEVPTTNVDAVSGDSIGSVGMGGMSAVGAYVPTGGLISSPTDAAQTIASNQQWGQNSFSFLVGMGMDGATVDKAVRDYLSGMPLTVASNGMITLALAKYGQPPEGLPDAPGLPTPTTGTTGTAIKPGYYRVAGSTTIYRVLADGTRDWLDFNEATSLGFSAKSNKGLTVLSRDDPMWKLTKLIGIDRTPKNQLRIT